MGWFVQAAGGVVVLLVLADIYLTVLHPRSGKGLLSMRLNKLVWQIFRRVALALPRGRDTLLSYGGPTLLALTVIVWVSLLILGFALVIWPALGSGIQASQGDTPTGVDTALYYSGYSLTTLGTGDIVPKTGSYRLLMVLEAVVGFSVLTMALTYFLSVYSALTRRNTFALSLYEGAGGTADAAELLAGLGPDGDSGGARQEIADMAKEVLNLLESHHSYPVLHYFRFGEPYTRSHAWRS